MNLLFGERVLFPIFRVELIFEHIDARVCDERKAIMEFFDIRECFSESGTGKSQDEVDIDRCIESCR